MFADKAAIDLHLNCLCLESPLRRKEAIKRRQVAVFSLALSRLFLFTIGFCVLQSFFRPSRGIYFNVMGRRMGAKTTFGSSRGITRIKKGNRALQRRERCCAISRVSVDDRGIIGRIRANPGDFGSAAADRNKSQLRKRRDVLRFSAATASHTRQILFSASTLPPPRPLALGRDQSLFLWNEGERR